jgi:hypothetical protein
MKHRRWNGIRVLILGLATAAFLVPAAQGYVYFGTGSASSGTPDSLKGISFYQSSSPALEQALAKSKAAYTPQALHALGLRWTKRAESYQASRPDDRAGTHGIGSLDTSDYVDRQVANLVANFSSVVHADDRGGVRGPGPVETPTVVSSHGGFDWTDAGIGASAMVIVAAMLAALLLMRKRPSVAV